MPFHMGGNPFGGGGVPFDIGNLFGMFGPRGPGPKQQASRGKGSPKVHEIPISLSDFFHGKELQIKDLQRELAATQEELSNLTLDLEDAQSKIAGFGTTKTQGECIKSAKGWNSLEEFKILQFAALERLNFVPGCPTSQLQPLPLHPPANEPSQLAFPCPFV
jgi:hypothetical protein